MFYNNRPFYGNLLQFAFCNTYGIFYRFMFNFPAQFIIFELFERKADRVAWQEFTWFCRQQGYSGQDANKTMAILYGWTAEPR